ncbi:MAG: GGDEF domain-containing protein [Acidobacteria bacterium]|nr:GGDEF domain-containing protein [Acidobacteriota bacterium]
MRRWDGFLFVFLLISFCTTQVPAENAGDLPKDIVQMKRQLKTVQGDKRAQLLSRMSDAFLGRSVKESLGYANQALELARKLNRQDLEVVALSQVGKAQCAGGEYKRAFQIFKNLLNLQEKRRDRKGIAYAMNRIGFALTDLGRYDEALANYRNALKLAREVNDTRTIASTLNEMGVTYWYKGDVDNALPEFQNAYRMFVKLGDRKNAAMAGINIGLLFHEAGMLQEAIVKYKESLRIFRDMGHREGIGTAYINLCSAYRDQHQLPEALAAAKEARQEFQVSGDKQGLADANASIGAILFLQGKRIGVEPYLEKALASYRTLGNRNGEADICGQLARLYLALGKRGKGTEYLKKSFEIYSDIKAKREAAEISRQLSHVFEEDGNYKEALHYANLFLFYGRKSRQSVDKLKVQYEKERLENQKELALQEQKIAELKAKKNRLIQFFMAIFLGVVLLILWILYRSFKAKKNANELLSTLNRRLRIQSRTDTLTGLPNRRSMLAVLDVESSRYERNQIDFALLMADIDDFKEINDTYGHAAGDEVLKTISLVFQSYVRQTDSICRWGGEEFFFLLRDTDIEGATILAEKIRKEVAGTVIAFNENELLVSVTIGVSSYRNANKDIALAISEADHAMYDGKAAGKNRVVLADSAKS